MDVLKSKTFTKDEARLLNPLQLALIGDGVYELFIRNHILVTNTELNVHKMHVKTIGYVKAKSQSAIMHVIEGELTDEAMYIFKRGRNAKSFTVPKNADVRDYRMATGFEALIGYLYLINNVERLEELLKKALTINLS